MAFDISAAPNYYLMQNMYLVLCYVKTQFLRVISSLVFRSSTVRNPQCLENSSPEPAVYDTGSPLQLVSLAISIPVPSNHCWVTCTLTDELNILACLLMSGLATGSDVRLLCLRFVCRLFFLPSAQRKGEEEKTKPIKTLVDDPESRPRFLLDC